MATGIYYRKERGYWRARIRWLGKEYNIYRKTEEEAKQALEELKKSLPKKEKPKKKELSAEEIEIKKIRKREKWKAYYWRNVERFRKPRKKRPERTVEERREGARQSYRKHKHKALARVKSRELRRKGAEPAWGKALTQKVYSRLRKKANQHAKEHHVDHTIPICGKIKGAMDIQLVCGLHVWYNLQLITAEENLKKGCYTWDDQPDYTEEDINELRERYERYVKHQA